MALLRSLLRLAPMARAAGSGTRNLSRSTHLFDRQLQTMSPCFSAAAHRQAELYRATDRTLQAGRSYSTAASDGAGSAAASGFSFPGPRKLTEIVKLQLLNKHGAPRVREIWNEYHKDHKSAVGDVLTAEEYGLLLQRSQRCRHFVFPVPRDGGYFTLLVQFQGKQCFMTYLEDYKQNAAGAQPYMTISMFDELLDTKSLALIRGEVTNQLKRQEGKVLLELIKQFYLGSRRNYDAVVAFNENAEKFDFKMVLHAAGIAAQAAGQS